MDSNHDKQIQNLLCYRYTTRQWSKVSSGKCPTPDRVSSLSFGGA